MNFSIVITFYNSLENSEELLKELDTIIKSHKEHMFELIIIDDGSSCFDITVFKNFSPSINNKLKIVQLNKNYGQIVAILTGLHYVNGQATIIMSSDLQDPPSLINNMISEHLDNDYELIAGVRSKRKDPIIRKIGAFIWYRFVILTINPSYPKLGGDYALLNNRLVRILLDNKSPVRFLQNELIINSKSTLHLKYERQGRKNKKSGWNIIKMSQLIMNILFIHSYIFRFIFLFNFIGICLLFLFRNNFTHMYIGIAVGLCFNGFFLIQYYKARKRARTIINPEEISRVIYYS